MILNSYKAKVLGVSRSRTVEPSHVDLVVSGVSIRVSPNLDILVIKFDSMPIFDDHVRGIVLCLSANWYFEVGEACLCGHLCVTSLLLCICSPNIRVLFSGGWGGG